MFALMLSETHAGRCIKCISAQTPQRPANNNAQFYHRHYGQYHPFSSKMCSTESILAVLSCFFSTLSLYRMGKQDTCVGVSEGLNLQLQGDMRLQTQEP